MVEVRPYRADDYSKVREILVAENMYYDARDSAEDLDAMSDRDSFSVLVAIENNEIVGSVISTRFGINLACIWALAVSERNRRNGIGTQLLSTMENILKESGVKEVWCFVDKTNDASLAFFNTNGYGINNQHTYYGPFKKLE